MVRIADAVLEMEIAEKGAEIISIRDKRDGSEKMWNRDARYWKNSAPVLFPFIGRLQDGRYSAEGQTFEMGLHGFVRDRDFFVQTRDESSVMLAYESTDEDYAVYPYRFAFFAEYRLIDDAVEVRFTVSSMERKEMHFALGFHPGFMIPEPFEAYTAVFPKTDMRRGVFSRKTLLWTQKTAPYRAEDGMIPLSHSLFDEDAIVLSEYGGAMAIADRDGNDIIRLISPDFPVLGLWQKPKSDARFLCLEPWSSYPGIDGALDDIASRADFIHLPAGQDKMMMVRIEFPGA